MYCSILVLEDENRAITALLLRAESGPVQSLQCPCDIPWLCGAELATMALKFPSEHRLLEE